MKYFVEDLPRSCFYCDCCHTREYDRRYKIDGKHFCGIMDIDVGGDYYDYNDGICCRPNWCPLKELPDKIDVMIDEWANGYNACLEDILGE